MIKTKRGNEIYDGTGQIDDYLSEEDEFEQAKKNGSKYQLNNDQNQNVVIPLEEQENEEDEREKTPEKFLDGHRIVNFFGKASNLGKKVRAAAC